MSLLKVEAMDPVVNHLLIQNLQVHQVLLQRKVGLPVLIVILVVIVVATVALLQKRVGLLVPTAIQPNLVAVAQILRRKVGLLVIIRIQNHQKMILMYNLIKTRAAVQVLLQRKVGLPVPIVIIVLMMMKIQALIIHHLLQNSMVPVAMVKVVLITTTLIKEVIVIRILNTFICLFLYL